MITALDVANTFLERAKKENISITPMKLQKLLYIFYKEYLKSTQKKVFADRFQTWKYGPVIQSVYDAFKKYQSNPIQDFYYHNEKQYRTVILRDGSPFVDIFNEVWKKYSLFNGVYLSQLTHQTGTAWSIADESNALFLDDDDIIKEESYSVE